MVEGIVGFRNRLVFVGEWSDICDNGEWFWNGGGDLRQAAVWQKK
jgi:hypothetical protein